MSRARPSSAAATQSPPSRKPASPTASRTSQPAAVRRSSSSAAASCQVWLRSDKFFDLSSRLSAVGSWPAKSWKLEAGSWKLEAEISSHYARSLHRRQLEDVQDRARGGR